MMGIEWSGVSKRFGGVTVIPDFSLRIAPGEFVALLGPSGCGKSTLLRMLAGLETVSAGRISIGERDITALPPGQRGIAMVFQQYALYPHMSVRANMAFGLQNIALPAEEIERRVNAAAQMLELQTLLERRPAQLSGGQRQRVAIGRAVVKEPAAFLFDEPLSNLDAALRSRTRVELARLHKRLRATMLFVTHDQVEAMTLADRMVVMNQGRIEQVGPPMEVYNRPATRFVAGFVGSPAMNFIPVRRLPDAAAFAAVAVPGDACVTTRVAAASLDAEGLFLGVRPESLTPNDAGPLAGSVEMIERLGDRSYLHVQLQDGLMVVADATRRAEPALGDTIHLDIDAARVHLFDSAGRAHHPS